MSDSTPRRPTAIVIGASAAGLFAAAVLAEFADVTVIESDTLPEGPETRRGVPQDRHAHLVWSGGVQAFSDILPGIVDEVVASGARLAHVMGDMVSRSPNEVWFRRFTTTHHHILVCSRPLLDSVLRARVLSDDRIAHHQNTKVSGLRGTAVRVTGVDIESGGDRRTLTADLIVDASGRGSRSPDWLRDLGLPEVSKRKVSAGVAYATRLYKAPGVTEAINFPLVNVQANPAKAPGQGGIILPIEGGRWIVTLSGTRGGEPTGDSDAFVNFALGLGDPIIGELLADAEPLSDVATTRSTANHRRYYEKMRQWPDGYVVLGDAIASYNPVYGHGLTVAAQCALAVRSVLRSHDITARGTARRLQRAAARPVTDAWGLAVGQDAFYPGATDTPPTGVERLMARYVDRCVETGARNPRALGTLLDVMSMSRRPTRLFSPDMLLPLLFGPRKPRLEGAPISEAERTAVIT
ncbi:FAD-dependent monooxygenase [Streptomyces europaeiscabiei]|uniref:FAD-dependent monooxygenase n=1 Tax=Streptomyces europaeiscabiei TaxID=146819 RepID=UPI0029B57655|nr:FAD-dependent monooxygenase [Streptomyces europaeiscabiei]MDX3694829.1 FAD-dependent monooxygenase [Streptomyces europaeiscabiei]